MFGDTAERSGIKESIIPEQHGSLQRGHHKEIGFEKFTHTQCIAMGITSIVFIDQEWDSMEVCLKLEQALQYMLEMIFVLLELQNCTEHTAG